MKGLAFVDAKVSPASARFGHYRDIVSSVQGNNLNSEFLNELFMTGESPHVQRTD